jgi:hypothetical protein
VFGLRSKSADGFLGAAPAPEPTPTAETFAQATARAAREATAKQLAAASANASLGVDVFNRLRDVEKLGVRLALLFDGHNPALANEIRGLVAESIRSGIACPKSKWWQGLGLPGF